MRNDDTVRLRHMIDAAETAGQFMAGRELPALVLALRPLLADAD